ncbi:MAG: DNA gyrase subunit A, partial [Caldisericia bacterium]|nr:DNA gyrase subunit A [Caldisericia bacterium]
FGGIMLSIVNGMPTTLGLIPMLTGFLGFRKETVTKRTKFQLRKAQDRKHILEGIHIAITNIDETIKIIRGASGNTEAAELLRKRFDLSDKQAKAILDMKLGRLTKLEVGKVEKEIAELVKTIKRLLDILENPDTMKKLIKKEFTDLRKEFADERRTRVGDIEEGDITAEDLITDNPMIIATTKDGYIKRVKPEEWRSQGRGGKGVTGIQTREEDQAQDIFSVTNKQDMLAFTNLGKVYKFKVYDVSEVGRAAKGTPITTLLPLVPSEFVTAILPVKEWDERFLFMVTAMGIVKKLPLKSFQKVRRTGIIAITLDGDDWLRKTRAVEPQTEIIIVSKRGQGIRFNEADVRPMGRTARGVIGIRLSLDDIVVGMEVYEEGASLLCVSENGYGKRTGFDEFRLIKRGGKGVRAMKINAKSGPVQTCRVVQPEDHLFIITKNGQTIKIQIKTIRECGRYATGVRLIRLNDDDLVNAITREKPENNGDHLRDE